MDLIIRSQDGKAIVRNPSCLDVGYPHDGGNLLWADRVGFSVVAKIDGHADVELGKYKSEAEAKQILDLIFRKLCSSTTLIYQMP